MTVNDKINALRQAMQKANIDAYIIPSSDAHKSEYVANHWQTRQWISEFTGSAGMVVITADYAGLWTDSRYYLQGETQISGTYFQLQKQGQADTPTPTKWLIDNLKPSAVVACDGRQFSAGEIKSYKKAFVDKGISLNVNADLINEIWDTRPSLPTTPIFDHAVKYAGKSRAEKLAEVRAEMTADYYLVTALDEIAWVLNLRGNDVECNPVFYAFLIIGKDEVRLFTTTEKVSGELAEELYKDNILIQPYDNIANFFGNIASSAKVQYDKGTTNILLYNAIGNKGIAEKNIIRNLKALKNETEVKHIKNAMTKDGVALTKLFRWLEKTVTKRSIPETEVAEKLASFRAEQKGYFGESFSAIVGYKGNGAIVHYRAMPDTCAEIKNEGMLLLDSGGQYLDGTTDITRTICFDKPSEEQRFIYTKVLKGHIELALAVFPEGTTGTQLDTLARTHLWQAGLNYGHGTGHGVGFFLNVHEGPQRIAPAPKGSTVQVPMQAGMLTSNEPGFYKADEYGIRIENLVLCKNAGSNEFGKWLKFEDLTLFPIDTRLIDLTQLNLREKKWLNDYHNRVYDALSPFLNSSEQKWLKEKTKAI